MIREVAPDWPPRWGGRLGGWGARPYHSDRWVPPPRVLLPVSSRLFLLYMWPFSLYINMTCGPPLVVS
jgi:hypothetical protein